MNPFDHLDLVPLLSTLIWALLPPLLLWMIRQGWVEVMPWLVAHLGEKDAASFQGRVDQLLDKAIAFGVEQLVSTLKAGGPITVDPKSLVINAAVNYAASHGQDLATQAGQLEEKVLARYAAHPMVQARIGVDTVADAAPQPLAAAA